MGMKLWIDDERIKPDEYTHWAKSSAEAIEMLSWQQFLTWSEFEMVSFDHDLGWNDTTRRVLTWMIQRDMWPKEIRVHTANPVGREWLIGTAKRYAPEDVKVVG